MLDMLDTTILKTVFPRIDPDISDISLKFAVGAANRRIRDWVGSEAYDDAALGDRSLDLERRDDLRIAAAHLAMSFALASMATVVRPAGIMISEKSSRGNNYTRYFTPEETRARSQELFRLAEDISTPYVPEIPVVVPDSIVESSEGTPQ